MTELTNQASLAAQYINSTDRHVFLTGKAGTGKTTFLHQVGELTHKNYAVVAPTGIAALNAGGTTIHSQFLLPFGMYIPDKAAVPEKLDIPAFNPYSLAKRKIDKRRRAVLQKLELLIIDEVSMLRADILDAINNRLKSVTRRYNAPFGGVQLLMIGDLHQLPPVVKNDELRYMSQYYKSPHFFEARALKDNPPVYIELQKIFRQSDDTFIRILNHLREDRCTQEDLLELNKRVAKEPLQASDERIILTTHNDRARKINDRALEKLKGEVVRYSADIEGDFPENLYPINPEMELKKDAQVMFIRNDTTEKRFYNGKIARVTALEDDHIKLIPVDENKEITLEKHEWQNIRYTINEETKQIEEEVLGRFRHFPLKLAWSITVHKSQGLTFDKAVIDVNRAFAPGQVYVALSRLRSLEGLTLSNPLNDSVVQNDGSVVGYISEQSGKEIGGQMLKEEQRKFLLKNLPEAFNLRVLVDAVQNAIQETSAKTEFEDEQMRQALPVVKAKLKEQLDHAEKFQRLIKQWIEAEQAEHLSERLEKGTSFFLHLLWDVLYRVMEHQEEVKQFSKTKSIQNKLEELDQLFVQKIEEMEKGVYLLKHIWFGHELPSFSEHTEKRRKKRLELRNTAINTAAKRDIASGSKKTGRKRKKQVKGETYQVTYSLHREGHSIEEIARQRELTQGTIASHLAKGIKEGEVELKDVLPNKTIGEITVALTKNPEANTNDIWNQMNQKYSHNDIRMVLNHLIRQKEAEKTTAAKE